MEQKHPLTIYRERQKPPLSQVDLAQRLEVTRAAISRWEAGKRIPRSVSVLRRIADVTGIGPSEIMNIREARQ